MKCLVDQAVSRQVAAALREAGHDAIHVRDIGLSDASDEAIMDRARRDGRFVISQDTDFGTLLTTSGNSQPSVILFRMRDGRPASQARSLLANIDGLRHDLEAGAIVVIEDAHIRVRRMSGLQP